MSKNQHLYTNIWKSLSIEFKIFLEGTETEKTLQLDKNQFVLAGNRLKSGYAFNLLLKNGVASNNIGGSAVARDLFDYLDNNALFKKLLINKKIKISMSKEFVLLLKKL